MTRRSAKLHNWADIARKRAEEVKAPNEAAQLTKLAEDLDELAQIYEAPRCTMEARRHLAGTQQANNAVGTARASMNREAGHRRDEAPRSDSGSPPKEGVSHGRIAEIRHSPPLPSVH